MDLDTGFIGTMRFGQRARYFLASTGSGDLVGVSGPNRFIAVPQGYISGNALSDISTYNNATFARLFVTPGTYEWTWGTGMYADSFTLQIGPATVPDSGSALCLLLLFLAGLFGVRRFTLFADK